MWAVGALGLFGVGGQGLSDLAQLVGYVPAELLEYVVPFLEVSDEDEYHCE